MKQMQSLGRTLYTVWAVFWFALPFMVLFLFLRLLILRKAWRPLAHELHRLWSHFSIFMWGLPIEVHGREKLVEKQQYVYCPNHSSYADIMVLLKLVPGFLNFVGKSSLGKLPLWGIIYRALYICVDRKSSMSRARSYVMATHSIEQGRSMTIYPEGKIDGSLAGKTLLPFQNGPFRLAIEKQVPLVPVTMPYNHHFLPDKQGSLVVRWARLKVTFHDPISTKGMTLDDLEPLKARVFRIIQDQLDIDHANRPADSPQPGALSPTAA
jgi:1-acyl-sn-glycerol-3-phosphate acyltransferase